MDQKNYDVIVIGAGPAGSTAAKFITEEGFKVLLIDRAKFPRTKLCGGALTRRIVERFPYISDNLQNFINSEIHGGKIYSPSLKYFAEIESEEPLGYMVLREKFDYELVKLAVKAGAEFWDEYHISDVIFNKNEVKIRSQSDVEVTCKIIIGADGVRSIIAKKSGLNPSWKPDQLGVCILREFDVDENIAKHLQEIKHAVHIHIGFEDLYGYAWAFLKKDKVNIGLGCLLSEKRHDLKQIYQQYIDLLKKEKIIPDLKIEDLKGALIPLKVPLKKTFGDNVILIGDAAGFVNPLSGEGLYFAMSSGENAAKICIDLLKKGRPFTNKNLSRFQKLWMKDFGKELKTTFSLRKYTRIWLEGIIKYAYLDKKWRNLIINAMLGFSKISKWSLAKRYFWCRIKYWFKDMFSSVVEAISYSFTLFYNWGARTLNKFVSGFERVMIKMATFGQNRLSFKHLNRTELGIWEDIYKTIEEPNNSKEKNMLNYVFSNFKLLLEKFVQKLRISIISF